MQKMHPSAHTHTERLCQFHQHFTSSFNVLTVWGCNFFSESESAKKLLVKCWWNWQHAAAVAGQAQQQSLCQKWVWACRRCNNTTLTLNIFYHFMSQFYKIFLLKKKSIQFPHLQAESNYVISYVCNLRLKSTWSCWCQNYFYSFKYPACC